MKNKFKLLVLLVLITFTACNAPIKKNNTAKQEQAKTEKKSS